MRHTQCSKYRTRPDLTPSFHKPVCWCQLVVLSVVLLFPLHVLRFAGSLVRSIEHRPPSASRAPAGAQRKAPVPADARVKCGQLSMVNGAISLSPRPSHPSPVPPSASTTATATATATTSASASARPVTRFAHFIHRPWLFGFVSVPVSRFELLVSSQVSSQNQTLNPVSINDSIFASSTPGSSTTPASLLAHPSWL